MSFLAEILMRQVAVSFRRVVVLLFIHQKNDHLLCKQLSGTGAYDLLTRNHAKDPVKLHFKTRENTTKYAGNIGFLIQLNFNTGVFFCQG